MSMIPSNIRQICDNHAKIIADLLDAAEAQVEDDFELDEYRGNIQDELDRLQISVEELARTLTFEAFTLIHETEQELLDVVHKVTDHELRDILIDEISGKFGVSGTFYEKCRATDPDLKLKLVQQVIVQSHEPAEVARKYVSEVHKDKFLDSFVELTGVMNQLAVKPDEWQLAIFFAQLSLYLEDQSRIEAAVEHIAAHFYVVQPMIHQLVSYGEGGSDDMKTRIVRSNLAVNCKFLAGLYAATNSPDVKELGSIATLSPSGQTPFAYLETMSLGLTPEWYLTKQSAAEGNYLIALMKHALATPGVSLNLAQLETNCEPWMVKGYLEGIKSAPTENPECAGKVKQLLEALSEQCQTHSKGTEIRREIMKSDLPRILLEPHLTLLGDRFTQELGV